MTMTMIKHSSWAINGTNVHGAKSSYDNFGLLDSGTTDHFLTVGKSKQPISITIPDNGKMTLDLECDIDWPDIPAEAHVGRIVPQLQQHALISMVKLCNAGCEVHFKHNCCLVLYQGNLVMYGVCCLRSKFWLIPLKTQNLCKLKNDIKPNRTTFSINNAVHTSSQQQLIEYLHQCFFSPTKSTILQAIKNDNLLGVPGLTERADNKYLPVSTATIKGHEHHTRKNLRSTKKTKNTANVTHKQDMEPAEDPKAATEMFCYAALADKIEGTIYTNLQGKFPTISYKGNRYIFLTYIYDANAIIVRPMKSRSEQCMIKAFSDVYEYLKQRKLTQKLHDLDNECSKAVEKLHTK